MPRVIPPWKVERDLLVKAEEETNPRHGYDPSDRPLAEHLKHGFINLDKPAGPTSHEVTAWTRRIVEIEKAGHGGTLDPKVTGVLPVVFEEARKIVQVLHKAGKEYVCVMRLHADKPLKQVEKVLKEFTGPIYQLPPLRASVKRRLRIRSIYYLNLLEKEAKDVLFKVGCEGGTYIRKLCHDVGEVLSCGAHMRELRRTRAGPLTEKDRNVTLHMVSHKVNQWKETGDEKHLRSIVQPMERIFKYTPKIVIRDSAVSAVCYGANLAAPGVLSLETPMPPRSLAAVLTLKGEAVALAKTLESPAKIMEMNHGFVAKTLRVLMPRNLYPKKWKR